MQTSQGSIKMSERCKWQKKKEKKTKKKKKTQQSWITKLLKVDTFHISDWYEKWKLGKVKHEINILE